MFQTLLVAADQVARSLALEAPAGWTAEKISADTFWVRPPRQQPGTTAHRRISVRACGDIHQVQIVGYYERTRQLVQFIGRAALEQVLAPNRTLVTSLADRLRAFGVLPDGPQTLRAIDVTHPAGIDSPHEVLRSAIARRVPLWPAASEYTGWRISRTEPHPGYRFEVAVDFAPSRDQGPRIHGARLDLAGRTEASLVYTLPPAVTFDEAERALDILETAGILPDSAGRFTTLPEGWRA